MCLVLRVKLTLFGGVAITVLPAYHGPVVVVAAAMVLVEFIAGRIELDKPVPVVVDKDVNVFVFEIPAEVVVVALAGWLPTPSRRSRSPTPRVACLILHRRSRSIRRSRTRRPCRRRRSPAHPRTRVSAGRMIGGREMRPAGWRGARTRRVRRSKGIGRGMCSCLVACLFQVLISMPSTVAYGMKPR